MKLLLAILVIGLAILLLCNWKSVKAYFQLVHKSCSDITISDLADEVLPPHIASSSLHTLPVTYKHNSGYVYTVNRYDDIAQSVIIEDKIPVERAVLNVNGKQLSTLQMGHDGEKTYINLNFLPLFIVPYDRIEVVITTSSKTTPQASGRFGKLDSKCMKSPPLEISWRTHDSGTVYKIENGAFDI